MAAGARTKYGERKKKQEKRKQTKHEAQIAAAEARIAATEKRIRWIQEFRARYSQFLLETRILTRPYVRRSYRLFTRRLAIFKREYELSTQKQWPFTDRTDFPFVMFCPVESL